MEVLYGRGRVWTQREILIVILGFDIVLLNRKPLIDQMKMYAYVLLIFFLRNKIMSEFYL